MISFSICLRKGSCTSLLQPAVTAFSRRFKNAVATQSKSRTDRCPINFPRTEKIVRRVSTPGTGMSSLLRLHRRLPHSPGRASPEREYHSVVVLDLYWLIQTADRRAHTFVNEYVVDVRRISLVEGFVSCDHNVNDGLHDQ